MTKMKRFVLIGALLIVRTAVLGAQVEPTCLDLCKSKDPSECLTQCKVVAQTEIDEARTRVSTFDNSLSNPAAATFVESATAISAYSLAIGNSSSLKGYQFPLNVALNPVRLLEPETEFGQRHGVWRNLELSQITFSYAPLVLKPRSDNLPGVTGKASRTVSESIKLALWGNDVIQDDQPGLRDLLEKGVQRALDDRTATDTRGKIVDNDRFNQIAMRDVLTALAKDKANLKRQFVISTKLSWQQDTSHVQPNSFAAELDLSKVLGRKDTLLAARPVTIAGSLAETWIGKTDSGDSYRKATAALGPTVTLKPGLDVTLQGNVDRYSGSGFPGIVGVIDPTRRTDIGLAEAIRFGLTAQGNLTLSVKELHLGTGNTDVALTALLAFAPSRLHPKASS